MSTDNLAVGTTYEQGNTDRVVRTLADMAKDCVSGDMYPLFSQGFRGAKLGKPFESLIEDKKCAWYYERGRLHFAVGGRMTKNSVVDSFRKGHFS